jgi:hypothetical protein
MLPGAIDSVAMLWAAMLAEDDVVAPGVVEQAASRTAPATSRPISFVMRTMGISLVDERRPQSAVGGDTSQPSR